MNQDMNLVAAQYFASNPSVAELRAVLGPRWAICRATANNIARYGKCLTRKAYEAATQEALRRRTIPGIPNVR